MRIGITSFATQGGSGILATELGLALAQRAGYEIHFISHAIPVRLRTFAPNVFFHEVDTTNYPAFPHAPYSLALASKMTEVARYHELDILHVHYAIPHAASSFLAKQMLAPQPISSIVTLHGTDITLVGQEPSFFPLTRFVIEQSDAVTAVSRFLSDETRRIFQIRRPVDVIHNFVDTEVFVPRPDLRAHNPLVSAAEPLLMHASNFRRVKNVPRVIEIFAQVRRVLPCKLALVGDGPERSPAESLARELGVGEDVLFLGNQESMEELLAMADVLLLPSEHESFGLVALEAMSCATPVVASRRGGLPEVIDDGRTGFLHDPDDVDGMVRSVLELLRDRALNEVVGAAGRAEACRRFCIRCVIEDYIALYHRVRPDPKAHGPASAAPG
jgi:N-acetyl-alpha-D-glucosaminyl L-malate synthase BshA